MTGVPARVGADSEEPFVFTAPGEWFFHMYYENRLS
jgi:hypothetical protein